MFSFSLPLLEIHTANEPVAELWFPGKRRVFCKIKAYGKFFLVKTRGFRGLFIIKEEYVSFINKTPVYSYNISNTTPLDMIIVDAINKFAKNNKLPVVRRQEARQSRLLRGIMNKVQFKEEAIKQANTQSLQESNDMTESLTEGKEEMNKEIEDYNKDKDEDEKAKRSEKGEAFYLIDYLKTNKKLTDAEARVLENKLLFKNMSLEGLIQELKDYNLLTIHEPMDPKTQEFLEEFGHEDPAHFTRFIDMLSDIDRKEKNMTAVPVKTWIPGSLVFAIIVGGAIGFAIIVSQWGTIQHYLGGGVGAPPPNVNPFGGFLGMKPAGFIFSHMPDFILKFFI